MTEKAEMLIKHGADIDAQNSVCTISFVIIKPIIYFLQWFCFWSFISFIFISVACDQYGNTPLHLAAQFDNTETEEMLIKLGANMDIQNRVSISG